MDKFFTENKLFAGLKDSEKVLLGALCVERKLVKDEFLFKENDAGSCIYFVADGMIRISKKVAEGEPVTLSIAKAGDIFGELAIIDAMPRYADAAAMSETRVYVLEKSDILSLKEKDPKTAISIMEILLDSLAKRLRKITDRSYGIY